MALTQTAKSAPLLGPTPDISPVRQDVQANSPLPSAGGTPFPAMAQPIDPQQSLADQPVGGYVNAAQQDWNRFAESANRQKQGEAMKTVVASKEEGAKQFLTELQKQYPDGEVMKYIPPTWPYKDSQGNTDYLEWYKRASLGIQYYETNKLGYQKVAAASDQKEQDRKARLDIATLSRNLEAARLSISANRENKSELISIVSQLSKTSADYDNDILDLEKLIQTEKKNLVTDPDQAKINSWGQDINTAKMAKKAVEDELVVARKAWGDATPGGSKIFPKPTAAPGAKKWNPQTGSWN